MYDDIMDASLNIVALIENHPVVRLSPEYNHRLIHKIREAFTESQQQLFVSSFYCYLNYHPTNDFVIDLDNVWEWLGFNQKVKAKSLLEKNFVLDKDYKTLLSLQVKQSNDTRGGHNKQTILLNLRTFKLLCIKAGTQKANEIHEYFVKLEDVMNDIMKEECVELKEKLENQRLSNQLEKELLRERTLIEQFPVNTQCVYYGMVDDTNENNEVLVKYGNSNHLQQRVEQHKKTYRNFRLVNAFKVENKLHIENAIKADNELQPFKRCVKIKDANCTEMLALMGTMTFDRLDTIIKDIITRIEYSPENYLKLLEENKRLQKIKCEYETFKKTTFKKMMEENNKLKKEYSELLHNRKTDILHAKLRKYQKQTDGFYYIEDNKYEKLTGTRQEVWDAIAYRTAGDLTKTDLIVNAHGQVVSKSKSEENTKNLRPICKKRS